MPGLALPTGGTSATETRASRIASGIVFDRPPTAAGASRVVV